jgi:ketosteroid isomerase-like protein
MTEPQRTAVDLMRDIFEPLERGERGDLRAFYDALDDEVMFKLSVGNLKGKRAVIAYLDGGELLEFSPFEAPLMYFGGGDRAVIVGDETIRVKQTGAVHRAAYAWVILAQDGTITQIREIQDVSGFAGPLGRLVAQSQAAPCARPREAPRMSQSTPPAP